MSFSVRVVLQGPDARPVEAPGNPVRLDVADWGWVKFRNKDFKKFEGLVGGLDNFEGHEHHTGTFTYTAVFKTSLTAQLIRQFGELVEAHRKQPKAKKSKAKDE